MRPKAIAISIVALLLIGASSHLVVMRISAQYTAPVITEGDFWEYKTSYSYQGVNREGIKRLTITGYKEITVFDTEYSVFVMRFDAGGSYEGTSEGVYMEGNWIMNGKGYYDRDDFQLVKTDENLVMSGTWKDGATGAMTMSISNTTNYEIISDTWEDPIDVGSSGELKKKASSYVVMHLDMGGGIPSKYSDHYYYYENITITCIEIETVSVLVGTFETYHIKVEQEEGSHYHFWYTSEIGNDVKIESYDKNDTKVSSDELTAYSYGTAKEDLLMENLLYIILTTVIAFIVVAVSLMILNRRKRRAVKILAKKPMEPPGNGVPETQHQKPPSTGVT